MWQCVRTCKVVVIGTLYRYHDKLEHYIKSTG